MPEAISVGRIVHYVSRETSNPCWAAIVVDVIDQEQDEIEMYVFGPVTEPDHQVGKFSLDNEPGTWHWPERV